MIEDMPGKHEKCLKVQVLFRQHWRTISGATRQALYSSWRTAHRVS